MVRGIFGEVLKKTEKREIKKPVNIILLGPPGVGKGTYAMILSKKYCIPHISAGDLFRDSVKNNTELGKKVREYLNSGKLVPDKMTIQLIKERLKKEDCKNGFVLEGFPRTIGQAKALKEFKKIDIVLNFVASDEVIMDRLSGRRTCKECGAMFNVKNVPPKVEGICDVCGGELYQREDETPEVIKKRLQEYEQKTKPLVGYYKKEGLLGNINANPTFEEINKIISQCDKKIAQIKT